MTAPHAGRSRTGRPEPAIILAGRITDIDPERWTCTVRTEILDKTLGDVQIGGSYLHPLEGEGSYEMPEVGALVYVCRPSEGDAPWFVLSYRSYPNLRSTGQGTRDRPSVSGNRPRMAPGDLAMVGRDKNGVYVRRGQLTEILGGALSRTLYLGREGAIQHLSRTSRSDTLAGVVEWAAERPEQHPEGLHGTQLDVQVKEFAEDRGHVVRAQVGHGIEAPTEGDTDGVFGLFDGAPTAAVVVNEPVLRVRVFEDGDHDEDNLRVMSSLGADKSGQVELAARSTVVIEVRGAANATIRIDPDGTITHTANGLRMVHDAASVRVGEISFPVLIDTTFSADAAAAWLEVIAACQALGLPWAASGTHAANLASLAYTATRLESE